MTMPTPCVQRFFSKIKYDSSGCWLWTGAKGTHGYGGFWCKRPILPHRWSFAYFKDDIPEGVYVCHSCDVPLCVNPFHLFLGTQKENIQDSEKKGRMSHPLGEDHPGSKLTEVDVIKIRRRAALGESLSDIAEDFSVTRGNVRGIVLRRIWNHI